MGDITECIARARQGDRLALDQLFQVLYPELRRIAHRRLAPHARDGHLDTTALVHECCVKLIGAGRVNAADRAHFLAYSATVMRSIIVDTARAKQTARRGGDAVHVSLSTEHGDHAALAEDEILDTDAALTELARIAPRLAQVVEMRYFAGMTDEEIGQTLGLTDRTVRRDWEKARLLLADAMRA
jgi:RNA polymerase sigma factor (TIGR02999 family)